MIEPVGCFIVPDGCGILSNMHSPESRDQRDLLFGSYVEGGNPVLSPTVQFMINKLCDHPVNTLAVERSASASLTAIVLNFINVYN